MMELDLRGTDAATLKGYLVLLGGTEEGADRVVGPDWSATLVEGIHRFAKWELPKVVVRFEGNAAEVARRFRVMAWRGGG